MSRSKRKRPAHADPAQPESQRPPRTSMLALGLWAAACITVLMAAIAFVQRLSKSQQSTAPASVTATPDARPANSTVLPVSPAPDGMPAIDTSAMQPRVAALFDDASAGVRNAPNDAQAWGRLGAVCDAHERSAWALPCFRQAQRLDPSDFRWPYLIAFNNEMEGGSWDTVVADYRRAATLEPSLPTTYFRIGEVLARQGQTAQAIAAFQEALQRDPDLAFAHARLGQTLLTAERPDEALQHLQRADQLQPNDGRLRASLAQAYRRLGRLDEAGAAAEAAAGLGQTLNLPDPIRFKVEAMGISSEMCRLRARRLIKEQDYAGALEQLRIVEETAPDDAELQAQIGATLINLNRPREALAPLRRAVDVQPDLIEAHVNLATVLLSVNETAQAMTHLEQALRLNPRHFTALLRKATALAKLGRLDEAIAEFERAAAISQLAPQAAYNFGNALMRVGRYDAAVSQFESAVQQFPEYVSAYQNMAWIARQTGDLQAARRHWERMLEIEPQNRTATEALERLDSLPDGSGG